MSVTRDTSHSPMGPCGPVEQSPSGDSFRHSRTALLSSNLDSGENTGAGVVVEHLVNAATPSLSSVLDCGENATWTGKGRTGREGEGEMGRKARGYMGSRCNAAD